MDSYNNFISKLAIVHRRSGAARRWPHVACRPWPSWTEQQIHERKRPAADAKSMSAHCWDCFWSSGTTNNEKSEGATEPETWRGAPFSPEPRPNTYRCRWRSAQSAGVPMGAPCSRFRRAGASKGRHRSPKRSCSPLATGMLVGGAGSSPHEDGRTRADRNGGVARAWIGGRSRTGARPAPAATLVDESAYAAKSSALQAEGRRTVWVLRADRMYVAGRKWSNVIDPEKRKQRDEKGPMRWMNERSKGLNHGMTPCKHWLEGDHGRPSQSHAPVTMVRWW